MSKPAIVKVYIDSNILISYALGKEKDEKFDVAKKVFDGAIAGKYKIVFSYFLLTETLHALRGVAARIVFKDLKEGLKQHELIEVANSYDFEMAIKNKSEKAFSEIINIITKDSKHFLFEDSNQLYPGSVFQNCLSVMIKTFGVFRVYRFRCEKCEEYISCNKCKANSSIVYKATNAPDLMHIFVAKTLGCDKFLTMDSYFEKIAKEVPIPIEILA